MITKATGTKRTVQMRLQSLGRLEPRVWEVESGPHTRAGGTAARAPLGWRPGCSFFTFPPFANHPRVSILCLLVDDKFFFCQVGTCCSY